MLTLIPIPIGLCFYLCVCLLPPASCLLPLSLSLALALVQVMVALKDQLVALGADVKASIVLAPGRTPHAHLRT